MRGSLGNPRWAKRKGGRYPVKGSRGSRQAPGVIAGTWRLAWSSVYLSTLLSSYGSFGSEGSVGSRDGADAGAGGSFVGRRPGGSSLGPAWTHPPPVNEASI